MVEIDVDEGVVEVIDVVDSDCFFKEGWFGGVRFFVGCEFRDGDDERVLFCEGLVVDEVVMVMVNLLFLVGKREYILGLCVWGFICIFFCWFVFVVLLGFLVVFGFGFIFVLDVMIGLIVLSGECGSGSLGWLLVVVGVWFWVWMGRCGIGGRGNVGGGEGCLRVIF